MKKHVSYIIITVISILCLASCASSSSVEDEVSKVVESFAARFYSWHFPDAIEYADAHGARYLQYLTSNVDTADVAALKSAEEMPEYSISDITVCGDSAVVIMELHNVFVADTIGRPAHMLLEAKQTITLQKSNEKWKIHSVGFAR